MSAAYADTPRTVRRRGTKRGRCTTAGTLARAPWWSGTRRVRAWKESAEAGAVNLNVAYYFGRRAHEQGKGWLRCARLSYESQRAARLGYVDAARSLMHLRTEWVGEFGTGLSVTKRA
jgi:hypothetical protein